METTTSVGSDDVQTLFYLLPVGTVLCHDRIITTVNIEFARIFGYEPHQLLGKSLELLYPSRQEFVDRGEQWRTYLCDSGGHCDERSMLRSDDRPVRMRVRGRCRDRADPYAMVACTFEPLSPANGEWRISQREQEIISAMAEGLTSKQIARLLNLSHRTVETYRQRLMKRTGARNASQLLALVR